MYTRRGGKIEKQNREPYPLSRSNDISAFFVYKSNKKSSVKLIQDDIAFVAVHINFQPPSRSIYEFLLLR